MACVSHLVLGTVSTTSIPAMAAVDAVPMADGPGLQAGPEEPRPAEEAPLGPGVPGDALVIAPGGGEGAQPEAALGAAQVLLEEPHG